MNLSSSKLNISSNEYLYIFYDTFSDSIRCGKNTSSNAAESDAFKQMFSILQRFDGSLVSMCQW